MPLPILLAFSSPHIVDAADVALTRYEVEVLSGPCFVVNIAVQNVTSNINSWEAVIHRKGFPDYTAAITLFQREFQRGIAMDVIWEGRRYIPRGWILEIHALDGLNLNDYLSIHGGYESIVDT